MLAPGGEEEIEEEREKPRFKYTKLDLTGKENEIK
jgi:hypothetical protein